MFILDIADDGFDGVLQRHKAVSAAVFVDDKGHLGAIGLHVCQQPCHRHRRRHEENIADQIRFADRARQINVPERQIILRSVDPRRSPLVSGRFCRFSETAQQVLDVNEPDRIVQRLTKDGKAGMSAGAKNRQKFRQAHADLDRLDVGARQHDVLDPRLAQAKDVAEHGLLLLREARVNVAGGERIGEVLADRTRGAPTQPRA